MWYKPEWRGGLLTSSCRPENALAEYAQSFTTVEGNTTFYGVPDVATAERWADAVRDDFRFVFKVPKEISHDKLLHDVSGNQLLADFFEFCEVFGPKLGQIFIQLPAEFNGRHLGNLEQFLQQVPAGIATCVEVRDMSFFNKGNEELDLLRLLARYKSNRVMFDTRGLFQDSQCSEAILDAQQKKPKVPLHVVATGESPVIRYLGYEDIEANKVHWSQWQEKLSCWAEAGLSPYFFMHTADNHESPQRARMLASEVSGLDVPERFSGEIEASMQSSLF